MRLFAWQSKAPVAARAARERGRNEGVRLVSLRWVGGTWGRGGFQGWVDLRGEWVRGLLFWWAVGGGMDG